jgi:hypothetical protein
MLHWQHISWPLGIKVSSYNISLLTQALKQDKIYSSHLTEEATFPLQIRKSQFTATTVVYCQNHTWHINTTCGGTLQQWVCYTALSIKWQIAAKSYDLITICVQTRVRTSVSSPQVQNGRSMMLVTVCSGVMPLRCTQVQLANLQCHSRCNEKFWFFPHTVLRHAQFVLVASVSLN